MKSLRKVIIDGAQVSDEAIEKPHRALPDGLTRFSGRRIQD